MRQSRCHVPCVNDDLVVLPRLALLVELHLERVSQPIRRERAVPDPGRLARALAPGRLQARVPHRVAVARVDARPVDERRRREHKAALGRAAPQDIVMVHVDQRGRPKPPILAAPRPFGARLPRVALL
eukprot:7305478-Prymnesium_polylepis.1